MKLINRQKLLLALLQSFGGPIGATDFQKLLFLFTRTCEAKKSYEFVPYLFGCYSFQAAADQRKLCEKGLLNESSSWELTNTNINYLSALSLNDANKVAGFAKRHGKLRGKKLIRHIYTNFPYFAINSEIAQQNLTETEYVRVLQSRPPKRRTKALCTIGYEGAHIENYLNTLLKNDIRVLIDVRKNPLSRKYGFSKRALSSLLGKFDIEYVHLANLGVDSSQRQQLETSADYERLFRRYDLHVIANNSDALDEILRIYDKHKRVAVTCFERDHNQCHRSRVIHAIKGKSDIGEVYNLVA